jgi:hypothetical protein
MSRWILAAIDGSGSRDWRLADGSNSHVYRLNARFRENDAIRKSYFHGPITLGGDCEDIVDAVRRFIADSLRSLIPELSEVSAESLAWEPHANIRSIANRSDVQICFIGHSRGGAIATYIARTLPKPVHFLGLFDSVDRSYFLEGTDVIQNVGYTSHARRDERSESRDSFGNTSLRSLGGTYIERRFMTSHGGIGGSYSSVHSWDPRDDNSCAPLFRRHPVGPYRLSSEPIPIPNASGLVPTSALSMPYSCGFESENAYSWMVSCAMSQNLPI